MSFLAPLFLLGTLAVGLPIVFHLIRRTTRERTPFSSLMFLFPTPPRLTKRSRLEHLLLLALRCLVLCLLALGFSRPFFQKAVSTPPPATARRVLLLVDQSASMRRAGLWAGAQDRVRTILKQMGPADQVALFLFDRQVSRLISFEQWNAAPAGERSALLDEKLAEARPGWSSTRLDTAMIQAAEALADTGGKPAGRGGEIILISDMQEGSRLEQLQGYEWPRQIKVTVETLKPKHSGNASLQPIESETGNPNPAGVRVRVSNTTDSKIEQFRIGWAGSNNLDFAGPALDAYVPPGQSRVVTIPAIAGQPMLNQIRLKGDEEDYDNVAFTVPFERVQLNVLYLGSESASDSKQPLYFLERAFQQTPRQAVDVRTVAPGATLSPSEMKEASLVVVADALPEPLAEAVHEEVAGGKSCLCVLKTEGAGATLAKVLGVSQVAATEARLDKYAMLGEIDFRDPLFASFADPRFSDFTKIHFWRYRRIDPASLPGARVLAKFDSGDPAIIDIPVGTGRVLLLTSGWQPEDSQLALSTKFVPLLYSILEGTGATLSRPSTYHVGDIVPVGSPGAASPRT
ncbi:MAG: BatA domain-containing protein, partial [Limisphaerales bacterium]